MRRFIYLFVLLSTLLFSIACSNPNDNMASSKEIKTNEEDMPFKIEKISLSQSYQNIKPNIELIRQGLDHRLFISLGLIESSGIDIKDIKKTDNEINIYVKNKSRRRRRKLVVPQVYIELEDVDMDDFDNLKFNIVNENYKPIKLKLGAIEAINKINSDYKISTHTSPNINIVKDKDTYIWELDYEGVFDETSIQNPIINLSAKVDANNGHIIEVNKESISSFIDYGQILDFVPNKHILYKKAKSSKENARESLLYYDIKEKTKESLYTSNDNIISGEFSFSGDKIALLEENEKSNSLYIIDVEDVKTYKTSFESPINPSLIRWESENKICIVDKNDNKSVIYSYDTDSDEKEKIISLDRDIIGLNILEDHFLIMENVKEQEKTKIALTTNWDDFFFNDFGIEAKFINENKIAYIKNEKESGHNLLHVYDMETKNLSKPIDLNISDFFPISNDKMCVIEKNESNSDFTLYEYRCSEDELISLANIPDDNIALNQVNNIMYMNSLVPFDDVKSKIIYAAELSQLPKKP